MADRWEGVSETGIITTGAERARVGARYEPILSAAIAGVGARDRNASLYVYGSVANGSAEPPESDADLSTIGLEPVQAMVLADRLSGDHRHLCRAVEIAPMTELHGESDEAYGNRVFLRHYCVHLAGPPRHIGLPDFAADIRAARGFNGDIARHASRWQMALAAGVDPADVGRRAARKTLLAVAGLVSIADHTWTTDRHRAANRWAQQRPEWAGGVRLLADWATGNAAPTGSALEQALDGVIAAVVDQFGESIGLWSDT